jgi:hypothetical protein
MSSFGAVEVEGQCFDHDVILERGKLRKRKKKPSKAFREEYGHTPLSAKESIPWHGKHLYIGTGMYGRLPIMPEVYAEARRRGVEVVAAPTPQICDALAELNTGDINAILHVTC